MTGGLLNYGREYMPGDDTRSGLDQLRGLLGAGQPYAEAVGGLLGYMPGMADALAAERRTRQERLAANPGKRISEVFPINEPWPANDAFGAALAGNFMAPIKAYHGSPHVFDKFSMDKIGTGEGAQAYGFGLYFAESPDVAKGYRDKLVGLNTGAAKRALQTAGGDIDAAIAKSQAEIARLEALPNGGGDPARQQRQIQIHRDKISQLEAQKSGIDTSGALYTTTLDVEPEDLLDWDKPLSEQSPKVREAITKKIMENPRNAEGLGVIYGPGAGDKAGQPTGRLPEMTGEQFHNMFGLRGAGAPEAFRSMGIPGLRYLDAGSRADGDGSRNIVMFDDSLIRIDERNGQPVGLLETPSRR